MVGLVVEELDNAKIRRFLNPRCASPRVPNDDSVEVCVTQFCCPPFDLVIPLQTESLEVTPLRRSREGVLETVLGSFVPFDAFKREGIGPIEMIQRCSNRFEECTSIPPTVCVGEPIGGRHKRIVLPGVIPCHQTAVVRRDHLFQAPYTQKIEPRDIENAEQLAPQFRPAPLLAARQRPNERVGWIYTLGIMDRRASSQARFGRPRSPRARAQPSAGSSPVRRGSSMSLRS